MSGVIYQTPTFAGGELKALTLSCAFDSMGVAYTTLETNIKIMMDVTLNFFMFINYS